MIDERFVFLGLAINMIGSIIYLISVLRGKTKPNRVTWLIWALAPMLGFFAQLQEGVGLQAVLTFSVGFGPLLIFIGSFVNKQSYWKSTKLDYGFGVLALVGLILWIATGKGVYAIVFAILADLLAGVPTLMKAYTNPESENGTAFGLGIINATIVLLTITDWRIEEYGFVMYILLICITLFSLIQFKLGPKINALITQKAL